MKELKENSNGNTRVLYHLNYYDGPISGVCLFEGKKYYFDTIDEVHEEIKMDDLEWFKYCVECLERGYEISPEDRIELNWYRIFAIYETPDNIMNAIEEDHQLFREFVGTHCDYSDDGCRNLGQVHKDKDHSLYYNRKKQQDICKLDTKNWRIIERFIGPF